MTEGDRLRTSLPSNAASASRKSPVDTPRRCKTGNSASRLGVQRAHFGKIAEVKRIFFSGSTPIARSRTFCHCTGTAPIPVWIVFRPGTTADNALAPIGQTFLVKLRDKARHFRVQRRHQHLARIFTGNL
jgi:hypothetical protein